MENILLCEWMQCPFQYNDASRLLTFFFSLFDPENYIFDERLLVYVSRIQLLISYVTASISQYSFPFNFRSIIYYNMKMHKCITLFSRTYNKHHSFILNSILKHWNSTSLVHNIKLNIWMNTAYCIWKNKL